MAEVRLIPLSAHRAYPDAEMERRAAEFACAILVAIGFYTRAAALPIVVMFGVILLKLQASAPWDDKDLALIYALPFLALFVCGPGRYSIDGLRGSPAARSVSKPREFIIGSFGDFM